MLEKSFLIMRLLGIDYGRVRIGLALGDSDSRLASPMEVLEEKNQEAVMGRLREIVEQEGIERIVVGVPKPLKDRERETDQAKEIRRFIAALREKGFEVVEEDETWSSAIAARQVEEMGRRGKRDDLAATSILQTYLDRTGESG